MRLCKDCWYFWEEKGICCNMQITKVNFIDASPMSQAIDLRNREDACGEEGMFWRPKTYSPNKIYKFVIECPNCRMVNIFELQIYKENGTRICHNCKKTIWIPEYNVDTFILDWGISSR